MKTFCISRNENSFPLLYQLQSTESDSLEQCLEQNLETTFPLCGG